MLSVFRGFQRLRLSAGSKAPQKAERCARALRKSIWAELGLSHWCLPS
jgi:hypothetical protein